MIGLRCDVCDIPVNTYEQLGLHQQGKAHLKKMQHRQLMANWTKAGGSPATNSNINSSSTSFWCDLCKINCSSQQNLEIHKAGPHHQALLQAQPSYVPGLVLPTAVQCKVCDISCNTLDQLRLHEEGSKHQKRVLQSRGNLAEPSRTVSNVQPQVINGVVQFRCEVCDIFCNTLDQLQNHNLGEKHQKRLRTSGNAAKSFNPAVGSPVHPTEDYMCLKCEACFPTADQQRAHRCSGPQASAWAPVQEQSAPVSQLQINIDAGLVVMPAGSREPHCRVCSTSCNTMEAMEAHVSGQRHMKNLKKFPSEAVQGVLQALTGNLRRLQIVEDTGPVANGALVECKVCSIKMNPNNVRSHFEGKLHRQKLVKAVRAPEYPVARPAIQRRLTTCPPDIKTKPRRYQEELLRKALNQDCVVFLPTGTGKTLVSALVLASMLEANPNYQAVFLVEKTLLVLQQAGYLREQLNTSVARFDRESQTSCRRQPLIASVCGDLTEIGENNLCLWKQDIIVTTVDFYLNLLRKEALRWEDICVVVFDEAHHCVKDHPFNVLLREYSQSSNQAMRPKILGLTASPAGQSTIEETYTMVKKLLRNMGDIQIAAVEEQTADLEAFSSSCKIQTCHDAADPTEQDLQRHLISTAAEIFERVLDNQFHRIVQVMRAELAKPATKWDEVSKVCEHLVDFTIKVDETSGQLCKLALQAFHELQAGGWVLAEPRITQLQEEMKTRPPHLQTMSSIPKLLSAVAAAAVTYATGVNISHVMSNLVNVIVAGLQRSPLIKEGKAVVLVLTGQRSIARSVSDYLDSHIREKMEDVQVTCIVGHGSTSGQTVTSKLGTRSQLTMGMTVSQQQKLLQKIKDLHFKVIVATSVAEEGVDLPSCGLVILLAPPTTMTALVQMRGRARLPQSEFVVLIREEAQEKRLEELLAREENMKTAVKKIVMEQKTTGWN